MPLLATFSERTAQVLHQVMDPILRPFRRYLVFAGLFSFFLNLGLLMPSIYMLQVFDRVLSSRSLETLEALTFIASVVLVFAAGIDFFRTRLLHACGNLLDQRFGREALSRMLGSAGERKAYPEAMRDVAVVRNLFLGQQILSLFDLPWTPLFVALTYLFNPLLGITATVGLVLLLTLGYLGERRNRDAVKALEGQGLRAGKFIDTALRQSDAVNAMGMQPAIVDNWQKLNDDILHSRHQTAHASSVISSCSKFLRQYLQVSMMAVGAWLVVHEHVSAGVMLASTIILGRALSPVESLLSQWKSLLEAFWALKRLGAALQRPATTSMLSEVAPEGALQCDKLVYSPTAGQPPILKGISFSIAAGEQLGIIGPSGSGKSSLARLLLGLWSPTAGAVRLDGAELSQWNAESLGRWRGYVPQDVEMLPGTVAQNIARMGAVDHERVMEAARAAGAHEMILGLPGGYDTPLGEQANRLSGGQRQQLALARALYGKPRLVVMDEPNAHLDTEGEQKLLVALAALKAAGTTVVVIAHKPSLLVHADKLLVLKQGAVEAFGPRESVMGKYSRGGSA